MIETNNKITDSTIYSGYREYLDGDHWIYVAPTARRNFVLYSVSALSGEPEYIHEFYLSAEDNDILADGVTITDDGGCDADVTIGHTLSKTIQATLWDGGKLLSRALSQFTVTARRNLNAFDGVVVDEEAFTVPDGATCYLAYKDYIYYGTDDGAYVNGQLIPATSGYGITSIEANMNDDAPLIFAGQTVFDFPFLSTVTHPTVEELLEGYAVVRESAAYLAADFMVQKYAQRPQSVLRYDSEYYPSTRKAATMDWWTWDCETGIKTHWVYIKLGSFRLDDFKADGDTIRVHGYDLMTLLDIDATEWVHSLDWSVDRTLDWLIKQTVIHASAITSSPIRPQYLTSGGVVNTTTVYSANPFASGHWTYRQILSKCAEWCGGDFALRYWQHNGTYPFPAFLELRAYSDTAASAPYYDPATGSVVTQSVSVYDMQCAADSIQRAQYSTPVIGQAVAYMSDGTRLSAGSTGETYYIMDNPLVHAPVSDDDYMAHLLTALQRVPAYKAWTAHVVYSDPRIEVGDMILSYDNDGTSYVQPIMSVTYHWTGTSDSEYASVGQTTRDVPIGDDYVTQEALEERLDTISGEMPVASDASPLIDGTADAGTSDDYSRADHVHPSDTSRVKKSGDTMTGNLVHDYGGARKSTISDSMHRVENASDPTQNTTQSYNGLVTTDGTDTSSIAPDLIETSGTVKARDTVEVGNDSSNGAVTIQQAQASSADPYNLKFKSTSSRYMSQHGMQYSRMYDSGTSGTAPATSGNVNNTTRSPNGYYASDNTNFSSATKGSALTREDGFTAKDGSEVVTHNAVGLTWEHAIGGTSSLRIFTLTHTSTVTAETTYTIDLPYGTYLFLHSRQTTASAASTGMQLVIIGQSVGSSAIIKTTAESGAQIGATSGTRSQVEISTTRQGATSESTDRIATVTWTVQGLSYRRLVMVRVM